MRTTKPTIKAIAEAAGVSIGTVDRVIHNRGEVARPTRDKILRIAEEMGYNSSSTGSARSPYRIVAVMPRPDSENTFWNLHRDGILQQASLTDDYQVEVTILDFNMRNENEFKEKARAAIDLNPDGIIFAPVFQTESIEFSIDLDMRKIPYIYIDTVVNGTNPISYIGEDAFQSGRVAASVIDFGIAPDKDILMLNIAKNIGSMPHLAARNQGFLSYFMDGGRNTGLKIAVDISSTDFDTIDSRIQHVLKHNDVGAIWVSNSKSYIIAQYLERVDRKDIVLVGYDVYEKNIEYLRRNRINFLIAQRPAEQGRQALRAMVSYLAQRKMPQLTDYQRVEIVNAETLRYYFD